MRQQRRVGRVFATTGSALLLLVGATACGGDGQPDTKGPSSASPSPSPTSATPTPSASPTPTVAPLSRFEGAPAVRTIRSFLVAYSTDINNGDAGATELLKWMPPNSLPLAQKYEKADLDEGGRQPGPIPFTPVSVKRAGSSTNVFGCMQFEGWSVDKQSGQPLNPRRTIKSVRINVKRSAGALKVTLVNTNDTVTCGGVSVKGVPWT